MAYDCMGKRNSPYGFGTPAVHPPVIPNKPNWMQALIHTRNFLFPIASELQAHRLYGDSSTTVNRREDGYRTKLAALETGPQSGPGPFPIGGYTSGIGFPWPVGTDFGPPADQQRKNDFVPRHLRGRSSQAVKPVYRPVNAPNQALHSSTPGFAWDPSAASGADGREDLVPIGGRQQMFRYHGKDVVETVPSSRALGYGLDYGPAPWRVPYMRKSGLSLMAGSMQFATQQQYSGVASVAGPSGSILAAPPVWSDITRGSRGVSGILQRVQGPGRSNVPGVFTPNEVR